MQSQSLGGVDLSRFVYGDNATKTTYFNDPNVAYSSGFYNTSSGTNMPYQSWWHMLINRHINLDNNYQFQIAADFWGDNTYFRKIIGNSSSTTAWRRILNDGQDQFAANLNQNLRTTDNVSFALATLGRSIIGNPTYSTNAGLSIGANSDFPGNSGWSGSWNSNLLLVGNPNATITFAHETNSLANIRYSLGTFYIGDNAGWGDKNVQTPTNTFLATNSGNVGIGTVFPSEKLSVNGNVRSKKLIVTQNGWSDYVFNDGYHLRPLSQVENFIKENRHLPEVPTAKEVAEKGVDVGETQALLLKKIEELTLYVIDQNKKLEELSKINKQLEQKNAEIEKKNITLNKRITAIEQKHK